MISSIIYCIVKVEKIDKLYNLYEENINQENIILSIIMLIIIRSL